MVHDEELTVPYGCRGDDKRLSVSAIDGKAWREAPSLARIAVALPGAVTLEGDGQPLRVESTDIEAGDLPLLGVQPVVERPFDEAETHDGAHRRLLGFGLGQRLFERDSWVVGGALRIEGEP